MIKERQERRKEGRTDAEYNEPRQHTGWVGVGDQVQLSHLATWPSPVPPLSPRHTHRYTHKHTYVLYIITHILTHTRARVTTPSLTHYIIFTHTFPLLTVSTIILLYKYLVRVWIIYIGYQNNGQMFYSLHSIDFTPILMCLLWWWSWCVLVGRCNW